jgi:hypothetical protein
MPITANITTATVLKASSGRVYSVTVTVAGAAGTVNDCTATGAAAASNAIIATPAAIGVQNWTKPLDFGSGIVASPGPGQTIVVQWE